MIPKVYIKPTNCLPLQINCLLCKGHTLINRPLCSYCLASFPRPSVTCNLCNLPLADGSGQLCAQCIKSGGPAFEECLYPFLYEYPVDRTILKIKYSQRLELIPPLSDAMADIVINHFQNTPWPEAMIPVPLHPKKMKSRGFNQALLITKRVRKKIPSCVTISRCIRKNHETAAQQGLSAKKRRKNIKNAFSIDKRPNYQHVAIIDDVMTTGATVSEMCNVLKRNGVEKIDVWCLARTPLTD